MNSRWSMEPATKNGILRGPQRKVDNPRSALAAPRDQTIVGSECRPSFESY